MKDLVKIKYRNRWKEQPNIIRKVLKEQGVQIKKTKKMSEFDKIKIVEPISKRV